MNMNDFDTNPFYAAIDNNIRRWVFYLRHAGLNTIPCRIKGVIQCASIDPTLEIERIKRVLDEYGVTGYVITATYSQKLGQQILQITAPTFASPET